MPVAYHESASGPGRRRAGVMLAGLILAGGIGLTELRAEVVVVCRTDAPWRQRIAAREVCRYLYVRTGELPEITAVLPGTGDVIVLAGAGDPLALRLSAAHGAGATAALDSQAYRLRTLRAGDRRILLIVGGDDLGLLYGAYAFAELLGVRFYLHGDVIPDTRLADWRPPMVDETAAPLLELRGIQPFHDFTEGPDWWNTDDYKAYLSQLPKLRMNFFGLHCYPEGGVGPEPLVWIGLPRDMDAAGRVSFSYPTRWASTLGGAWGYAATPTSEFAAGAARLFDRDDFGPDVTEGHRPRPTTPEACNQVFNRAAAMFADVFSHGRALGVKFCIGTETPLTVPAALQERLRGLGMDPASPQTVGKLYEGTFQRIARAYPVDYYWLWTPEGWTWNAVSDEQVEATVRDLRLALDALRKVGRPFELATCGWVLGPPGNRALFDELLPKEVAISCINRDVGFDPVEPGFALVAGRPQWAIPWLEDDPAMIVPQLWVGRMRRDAADALTYGCNGLIGIHWRTKVLGPNLAALAAVAWQQAGWNRDFGNPVEPPRPLTTDVHVGGATADYPGNEIANTDHDRIYQTCRWNVDAYRVAVPNGIYDVTLQFCEVHYGERGRRVFGVKLEGRQVLEGLDVFGRVGRNVPLDISIKGVTVDDAELSLDFIREVEFPFIAGIAIVGHTADSPQAPGQPFARKINCGGRAYQEYEPDLPAEGTIPGLLGRPRDLPSSDFYADWAQVQFGPEVAEPLAALFTKLDGSPTGGGPRASNLPRPADWDRGPGGIKPNRNPWETEQRRYAFVDEMAALRPRVAGAGNLDRFDYWLNTFRYLRAVGEIGCTRGRLDLLVEQINAEPSPELRRKLAADAALPVRLQLARLWEELITLQLAVTDTPGELGTIANLEQHVRRHNAFFTLHDGRLTELLGPLPAEAEPSRDYAGQPRIIVPTVRGSVMEGEALELKVIILAQGNITDAALHVRAAGEPAYRTIPLRHVARGVYRVALPAAEGLVMEYYVSASLPGDRSLAWPASAPRLGHTLAVFPPGIQSSGRALYRP